MRHLLLFAAAAAAALAQNAELSGRITDSSGALIPGARVRLTQERTGLERGATANPDGYYSFLALGPGSYRLAVEHPGFRPVARTGITLEVRQTARVDVTLEVGSTSDAVTVSGELPRVQTQDATLGTVVERQRIEELPLNGRHVFNLVKIVAGVQPRFNDTDGFAEIRNQNFSQIRFNGGPWGGNQFFLDGAMNTLPVANEIAVVPMVDAIEEFKVETNSLKAEYGQTSGGVVTAATKSGTNAFHGSLYEFLRNDSLNARNAFAVQRDRFTGRIKPILRYNQFGGTAGGPVRIPRLYDGRNRTFFFAGYEQWRHCASQFNRGTVPVTAQRNGDFSDTRDGRGAAIPLFDPATTRANPAGSGFIRDRLPNSIVPRSRIDPLAIRVLEFMPRPNAIPDDAFTNSNNFLSLVSSPTDQGVTNLRFDHVLSSKDNLTFRYTGTRNTFNDRGFGLGPADPLARIDQRDNHNWLAGYTRIASPSVLNEFRGGATRQFLDFRHPSVGEDWPRKLGYPAIIPPDQFPIVAITGMLSLSRAGFAGGFRAQHTVQFADTVSITRGKHQLKAGVDFRITRQNWLNKGDPSGRFSFGTDLTGNPQAPQGTGFGMATYLLGEVSGGQLRILPHSSFHSSNVAGFVQEDLKLTPRLTLNLGVRYDFTTAPVERYNRFSSFDPFLVNPQTSLAGMMRYAGVDTPRNFVNRDFNNIGPRFGFAWDVSGNGRTAVRGGYGIVYLTTDATDSSGANPSALGFSADTPFVAPSLGPFKAFQFSQGPPALVIPRGAAGGPSAFRGLNVQYQDRNAPAPYLQQWNFTIQRQLPAGFTGSASYAGNRGVKLFGADYEINQLDPANFTLGLALQDQVNNPFFGQILTGALSGRTVQRSQLLRPLPDYLNVPLWRNRGASSVYHSLQLTVERRYSKGLSLLFSYTNGKLINDATSTATDTGGGGDFRIGRFNRFLDRSLDEGDISQRVVASAVWEIPAGKQRMAVTRALLSGWQLNTVTTAQTGVPLRVRGASNFTGIAWPDVTRDPTLDSADRSVIRWFDTDAFRNPRNFTIGNVARTLPRTRAPGLFDMALSLFKVFRVAENMRLEFRAEAFNALNHVNYAVPNTTFTPNAQGVNNNANFGRSLSALNARALQFGLRLVF
ncbi:MAG: TonB-dependent receptor [Acidobacteria bacterium]|nr:TonB-dependent receptor [Acidobacteriota bacterium]